ncbi:MAG: hypothetical protein KGS61_03155, partial [Verrucomicrobia bacterium]|nr:hypothetical protein [Verrucomicrobiota bacterium]
MKQAAGKIGGLGVARPVIHVWMAVIAWGCLVASQAAQLQPAAAIASAAVPIADLKRSTPVNFEEEILPVLKRNCLACHNTTKAKASLVLETPASILKGSEDGPVVVPRKGSQSLLLQVAAHAQKPFMPPRNNPVNALTLTPTELGLVKLWIDQGATGVVTSVVGPVHWQPLPPGLNEIDAVAITADGQFAACGRANQIFIYHLPSGQLVTRLTDPALLKRGFADQPGVAQRDLVQALAFSPDGSRLASGGYREVKLWRRQPNTQRATLSSADIGDARVIASSPDGKCLAFGGRDGRIRLWDPVRGKLVRELTGHTAAVRSVRFSPDGAELCSGSADQTIRVWRLHDGRAAGTIITPAKVNAVAWVRRGAQIASAGDDNVIRLWSLPSASGAAGNGPPPGPVRQLTGHSQPVTCLDALGLEGNELVSGSRDGTVRVWDLETGKQVRELKQGGPVTAVAVRPDGGRFAAAGLNKVVRLWNANDGQLVAELTGERHAQEAVQAAERALAFVKQELTYQQGVLENASKQEPADTNAVSKAAEAHATADRALAEQQSSVRLAREAKTEADKGLNDAAAAAKLASDLKEIASKVATLAVAAAQSARDKAAQAKAAVDQATAARSAADKSLVELTRQAKAAAQKLAQAKTPAPTNGASPVEVPASVQRAAAETAATAKSALDRAAESRIALDRASARQQAAEQAAAAAAAQVQTANVNRAAAERLSIEAAKRQRDEQTRAKAAEKSLAETEQTAKRAEEANARAAHLLQDAQKALKRTAASVESARTAIAAASA